MRPKPSLAAKSGVGELAARESEAPNASARERERGELQPPIWPAGLRFCGPYCFLALRTASVDQAAMIAQQSSLSAAKSALENELAALKDVFGKGKKIAPPSTKVQIDVRLDEIVLRALEKKPELRYQQVSEVKTMVETISRSKPNSKPKMSMKRSTVLFTIIAIIIGISLVYKVVQTHRISQSLEPLKAQPARASRQMALRGRFEKRMAQDRSKYTADQLREAENLMRIGDEKYGSPEANESCQTLIKNYPDSDRAGCAMLYLAQMSQGDGRARYLQECIDKYNDCFYGDGVQVGVYARFLMAQDYRGNGERAKADDLFNEIKSKYPDAVDHSGNLLVNLIKANKKLQ